ncbi:MAG: hypothetical protein JKY15_04070 [Deltaproteobacteria bacterium]|nr:hypothetical protein [Deltaproteobacteria bacterium]
MKMLTLLIVAAAGFGFWVLGFSSDPTRSMYGYLFGFVSALTIPLGCMFFVLIQHLTRAGWSVLTRRVAEFGMAVVPIFAVLFIPIVVFGHDLFPWSHTGHLDETLIKKAPYLNMSFFVIRAVIYFAIWTGIGVWFYRKSVEQDLGGRFELTKTMGKVGTFSIILLALSTSFASFDWLMSLQPHWYSTVFGVYFFAGCFLAGLAFMSLMLMRSTVPVTAEHYQDLGKLLFGFTMFWAYIGFSQFMIYWYANIPEETEFYLHRLEHGWSPVSYALIVTNFFIPFFLIMSRHAKRNKSVFAAGCIWIMLAHFVDIYWLVMPTSGAHHWQDYLVFDVAVLIGFVALFLAAVAWVMKGISMVPKGDPRLPESIAFENY